MAAKKFQKQQQAQQQAQQAQQGLTSSGSGGLGAAMAEGAAVPSAHREMVKDAGVHIDKAARLLGQTRHSYHANDPAVQQLLEALLRLDLALGVLDRWLERHPAREARG